MNALAGFWHYFRFIIKRERFLSLIWIASLVGSMIIFAGMYPSLFPTAEELLSMALTMENPAMVALMGPVYGMDSLTVAMVMAQECFIWFAIALIIMNIFFVNRYTRADEELGRLEMFKALPMGRLTSVATTMLAVLLLDLVISALTMAGLVALDIAGTTVLGAFVYSFGLGAVGFCFATITLLLAQLLSTSRGVLAAAFALFGGFYVLRAWGDIQSNAASLLSPLGLALKVQAFYGDQLWPLAVLLALAVVVCAVAAVISVRRDLGQGVIPARPGRKHGSAILLSPFGLAWRLSRNSVLAWAIAAIVAGAVYGSIVGDLDSFLGDNEIIRQMVEGQDGSGSLIDSYITMLLSIMGILAAVPVVNSVLKINNEEKRGRIEMVYATATARTSMYRAYILIALLQSVLFMVLTALGFYAAGYSSGQLDLAVLCQAALAYLPAIWLTMGLIVVLVGALPRFSSAIWAVIAYSFAIIYFGRMFKLPDWIQDISPFGSIPQLPVASMNWVPLVVQTVLALVLVAVGVLVYRQRDLQ